MICCYQTINITEKCQWSCVVQSNSFHCLEKLATACFCTSSAAYLCRLYISSSGKCSMPLRTFNPRLLLKSFSSSMTWTNPLFKPNSTWKYGKSLGIELRRPFWLVSMSFLALCWLHSSSASSIACDLSQFTDGEFMVWNNRNKNKNGIMNRKKCAVNNKAFYQTR